MVRWWRFNLLHKSCLPQFHQHRYCYDAYQYYIQSVHFTSLTKCCNNLYVLDNRFQPVFYCVYFKLVTPDLKLSKLRQRREQFVNQRSISAAHTSHDAITQSVTILLQKSVNIVRHLNRQLTARMSSLSNYVLVPSLTDITIL